MISSSRHVIKEWNPEKVREFIPPLAVSQPVVRELHRRNLDVPEEDQQEEQEQENFNIDEVRENLLRLREEEEEARQQTALELEEARRQAEELLENARAEAEQIKEEARLEGFAVGKEEGRKEGQIQAIEAMNVAMEKQQQSVREELSQMVKSVEQAKNKCLREYLDQLKECAFAVAEKVIHTSLDTSGDIIKRMIVFETEKLRKTAWLKIYMEKMDYDMMMEADADLVTELTRVSDNIKFIVMEKEQRGSCIIETPEEILDIGVETQMENIRDITGTIRI
ncbi:MAG: flagellar biosynthesis/type III secretory pathway protein [Lachnospiraceae bacterium]|nr:flagellar biosynthesis/type III secretory pathway protein [Lachnospiraceae bacterium]